MPTPCWRAVAADAAGVRRQDLPLAGPTLPSNAHVVVYCDEGGWGAATTASADADFLPSGTAHYLLTLVDGMVARGCRTTAICQPSGVLGPLRRRLIAAGADVEVLEQRSTGTATRLARASQLWRLLRSRSPTVTLMLMGYYTSGGTVAAVSRAARVPVVRADLTAPEPPFGRWRSLRLAMRDVGVHAFVVGSEENRRIFAGGLHRNPTRVEIVWTGIDLARYTPGSGRDAVRSDLGFTPTEEVVGIIARLSDERKGVKHFLEAAAMVAGQSPSARFLIVGDGPRRYEFESLAARLGIAERTLFAGYRPDVPGLLAAMDIFVMPSLAEGGPTVLLEAMAMGRPVVTTRVGMATEAVEPEHDGIVVEPGDALDMSEGVIRLINDSGLRAELGRAARARAQSQFSREAMVNRYLAILAHALDGRARPSLQGGP